ncbi:MAG: ABC transporter substrate-binding protein [Acidobacteria bacterium]|nr:ABC transporter substrate-binding protein [Acidobacteriota bacterium]
MRKHRLLSLLALLAAFGLIAAACGDDDDGDGGSDETSTTADAADADGDDGDDGDEAMGDASEVVLNLGYILPQTGDLAAIVDSLVGGIELAIADMEAAGATIVLTPADSGTNPDTASANVDQLITDDVDAILGAAASGVSGSIIDKVSGSNIVQCTGSSTAAVLSEAEDNGFFFRTAPSDILQGPALADVIAESGATNIAVVYRNDDYGSGFNDVLTQGIEDNGGTIAASVAYDPEATSFDAEVSQVVDSGADAVAIITFAEGAQLLQSMIESGVGPADLSVFVADGFKDTISADDVDPNDSSVLDGIRGTAPSASPENGEATFPERYAEFVGPDVPTIFSAQFYDCTIVIGLAAAVAGSSDPAVFVEEMNGVTSGGETCTTFSACMALVNEGTDIDYDGASGPLEFTEVGEPAVGTYDVFHYDTAEAVTDSQVVIE